MHVEEFIERLHNFIENDIDGSSDDETVARVLIEYATNELAPIVNDWTHWHIEYRIAQICRTAIDKLRTSEREWAVLLREGDEYARSLGGKMGKAAWLCEPDNYNSVVSALVYIIRQVVSDRASADVEALFHAEHNAIWNVFCRFLVEVYDQSGLYDHICANYGRKVLYRCGETELRCVAFAGRIRMTFARPGNDSGEVSITFTGVEDDRLGVRMSHDLQTSNFVMSLAMIEEVIEKWSKYSNRFRMADYTILG